MVINKILSIWQWSRVVRLFAWFALLTGVASAQVDQNRPGEASNVLPQYSSQKKEAYELTRVKERLPDALARLKQGEFFPADIHIIAVGGAVQAIPDLKKQFDLSQDQSSKDSIASALVKLGDKDPTWWDYLTKEAADAIVSDAPSAAQFDSKGKFVPGPSPEFIAWAKAHNLKTDSALQAATSEFPAKVLFLGESGDRRAIPLLRQALSSPNVMIQTFAVRELAQFQDKASIPLIIGACQQAPADAAYAIASGLRLFDDPRAQGAAKEYAPLKDVK
ncbi:MAG: HEAT repeat domain-containing protein [Acidobacteriota bacterium]|nr:HEAT repeat domain-containing protein [Acidobacteriota bacterium]